MPQGLTIWDEQGRVTFDSNSRRPRVYATFTEMWHGGSLLIPIAGTSFAIIHPNRPISELNLYYSPAWGSAGAWVDGAYMRFATYGNNLWSGYCGVL